MSLLDKLLGQFYLQTIIFHRAKQCNTWATDTSGTGLASFHFISSGKAYLHTNEHQAEELVTGDIVIFPHDAQHWLGSSEHLDTSEPFISFPPENNIPNSTGLMCGYFDFSEDKSHPLLQQLPQCILIKNDDNRGMESSLIHSLIAETERKGGGNEEIIKRITEAFFMSILRTLSDKQESLGFFRALQDNKMRKVLMAIEQNIAANWDVSKLAEVGGYSRASFAQHFKSYIGQSPMEYLTAQRLSQAHKQLRKGISVFEAALNAGYQSESAFAKAYKRQFGFGPGASRSFSKD
ncbi:MAG: cupin domain-containing protein [Parashewanella sp.]